MHRVCKKIQEFKTITQKIDGSNQYYHTLSVG